MTTPTLLILEPRTFAIGDPVIVTDKGAGKVLKAGKNTVLVLLDTGETELTNRLNVNKK